MRALAVQQRTVWHPGTVAINSTLIPASSAPPGLPEGITKARFLYKRDVRVLPLDFRPMAKGTQMVASAWIIHDPQCKATTHVPMGPLFSISKSGGPPVDWPGVLMGLPEHNSWTYVQKSINFASVTKEFDTGYAMFVLNQTHDGLCTYYIADDRVTLTP